MLLLMHVFSMVVVHVIPMARMSHAPVPVLAGVLVMATGALVARRSLTHFRRLRESLTSVRSGGERRVEGAYPSEVQPLIDDLNALLEDRENAVKRAVATAGDLAHGLKTPLALLAREAERAAAAGQPELAENIAQQVERMSRQAGSSRGGFGAHGVEAIRRARAGDFVND